MALGGGVCGDLAGFAAGCYLRGIRYIQVPTTLLAAVDSSVGGKTAVDLNAGKNLAGLFFQPSAVLCDTDCLQTLSDRVFADGVAEAIKTGVIGDETLFSLFETGKVRESLPEIVARCVAIKSSIVELDEFEHGPRRLLNLGHTVGHAVEKCSAYQITHGHAVAIGMAVMARAGAKLGICTPKCATRIEHALVKNGLPISAPFPASMLAEAALADKKRTEHEIILVFPRRVGECILQKVPMRQLKDILNAGMEGSEMKISITPGNLSGTLAAVASKSDAQPLAGLRRFGGCADKAFAGQQFRGYRRYGELFAGAGCGDWYGAGGHHGFAHRHTGAKSCAGLQRERLHASFPSAGGSRDLRSCTLFGKRAPAKAAHRTSFGCDEKAWRSVFFAPFAF